MNFQSLARRVRPARHAAPGAPAAPMPANTAPVPAPVFTPAGSALANTAPIHIPGGRHVAPGPARPAPRPPRAAGDAGLLRSVLDGLRSLPDRAPARPAAGQQSDDELRREAAAVLRPSRGPAPAPVPARVRAARFTADMRKARSGGLPLFRETGIAVGWCGLDSFTPAGQYARWSTDRWARQAMARIAAQTIAAKSEIGHDFAELGERYTRAWAAADAALALGYPGEAL